MIMVILAFFVNLDEGRGHAWRKTWVPGHRDGVVGSFFAMRQQKGFILLNFGKICGVNHENMVMPRSETVDMVIEVYNLLH